MKENQSERRDLVANNVYINQSMLVEALFKRELIDWDEIENLWADCAYLGIEPCPGCRAGEGCENQEAKDIFEWWAVSFWLLEKLREHDEPVLHNQYGQWWGRTTTGQAIYMDGVIGEILEEIS